MKTKTQSRVLIDISKVWFGLQYFDQLFLLRPACLLSVLTGWQLSQALARRRLNIFPCVWSIKLNITNNKDIDKFLFLCSFSSDLGWNQSNSDHNLYMFYFPCLLPKIIMMIGFKIQRERESEWYLMFPELVISLFLAEISYVGVSAECSAVGREEQGT